MAEYIVKETSYPLGTRQEVIGELIRCKDCKHRGADDCPMYFVEWIEFDDDGYTDFADVITDNTVDEGFCNHAERRTDESDANT